GVEPEQSRDLEDERVQRAGITPAARLVLDAKNLRPNLRPQQRLRPAGMLEGVGGTRDRRREQQQQQKAGGGCHAPLSASRAPTFQRIDETTEDRGEK